MNSVAIAIKDQIDTLAQEYSRRLLNVDGYAEQSDLSRFDTAHYVLNLMVSALEAGNSEDFTRFIKARINKRVAEGISFEALHQVLTIAEDIVMPLVTTVESAKVLWAGLSQARTIVSKSTAGQLQESEKRIHQIIDTALDAVITINAQGVITGWNSQAETFFGWSAQEAVGELLYNTIIPAQFKDAHKKGLEKFLSTGEGPVLNQRIEIIAVHRDGHQFPVELAISLLQSGESFSFSAFVRDITERKQAEEALRESEERFRQVINSISDHIYVTEVTADGYQKNRYLSPNVEALTGYRQEDFLNDWTFWPQKVIHPDDKDDSIAQAQKLVWGQSSEIEYRLIKADGQVIWVRDSALVKQDGSSRVIYGLVSEITERKQLELQIQESLEHRGRQVQTSTEIAQEIAAAPVLGDLFRRVVELVQTRFGYYHAHVYTLAGGNLVMQEGTGDAGRQMKEAGHKIAFTADKSLVARTARSGEPVLVSDVSLTPDWLPNPLLPETKSELAVPIKLSDEVLGVLDVQHNTIGGLNEEDQLLLLGLCGQIAVAINTRRTEDALAHERDLLQLLMDNSLDHIYFKDIGSRFVRVGNTQAKILGLSSPSSAIGKTDFDFFTHDYARSAYGDEQKIIKTGRPLVDIEEKETWPDGRVTWFSTTKMPLRDKTGDIIGTFGISRDITQRKQAELELEERLNELNSLQQVTSKEGWEDLRKTDSLPDGYFFDSAEILSAGKLWVPEIKLAVERKSLVSPVDETGESKGNVTVAPLLVHNEPVGALGVYNNLQHPLSSEELTLVEAVSEQVALALEGARLFEQTQQAGFLLGKRVKELDCLNDIGREIAEIPVISEFLQWVTLRIPPAMQSPDICLVAITYNDQLYGVAEAMNLPTRIVNALRVNGNVVGRLYIAYSKKQLFLAEESALLGGIANRISSYIESRHLFNQTREALSEVRRLAAIVENHPDFIGVGTLTGQALYVNPAGLKLLGLPPNYDVTTMTAGDFFPAEDAELLVKKGVPLALEKGSWSAEVNMLRVDGTVIPVEETIGINYDLTGNPFSFSITMRDITERRGAEAERERLLDEVEGAYRQYVRQEWNQYLGEQHHDQWQIEYRRPGADKPVIKKQSAEVELGSNGADELPQIDMPISLRGQDIGILSLQDIDPDRHWTAEEIALVEAVSRQLALTIENLRLFDNTQHRATREQLTREITDKMHALPDVNSIVETGLAELSKALGVSRTYVKLSPKLEQSE